MAGISASLIASALSLSLMASSNVNAGQLNGKNPVAVASLQANLDVLGFNAGTPDGHIRESSYEAVAKFVTQFGHGSSQPINTRVAQIVRSLPDLGTHLSGASILAIQSWFAQWHLYHGPLNGQSSAALMHALNQFQRDTGIPQTNQFNGATLATLAHLAVVREAVHHHWQYIAEPGDQMRQLAWAAAIPIKQFEAMNAEHHGVLWVGQVVHFSQPKPIHSSQPSHPTRQSGKPAPKKISPAKSSQHAPASKNPEPSTTPTSTGVFSNIQPIAAFVVYNPSSTSLTALLQAQKSYPRDLIDLAVTGQWAVNHAGLMKTLGHSGNELVMSGYTGVSLNQLPGWGIKQEIQWSQKAIENTTGSRPVFVSQTAPFTRAVQNDVNALNVIALSPNIMEQSPWSAAKSVSALLAHSDQIVGSNVYPNSVKGWQQFFGRLQSHHFVFLNLGQIWADTGNG